VTRNVHVFCGWTLSEAEAAQSAPDAVHHPPAWAGDLAGLGAGPGDTVILIDGALRHADPVPHGEILRLLASGVAVAGVASFGAVRAAELDCYGMTGAGVVYAGLCNGTIIDDEAVDDTVSPGPPAGTAIRPALARAVALGVVTPAEARLLRAAAAGLDGRHATWQDIARAARPQLRPAVTRMQGWHKRRAFISLARQQDARDALARAAAGTLPAPPRSLVPPPAGYASAVPAPVPSGPGTLLPASLRPWQLSDPGFPERWRQFVLHRAGAAAAAEVDAARLRCGQIGYWLTPGEAGLLDPQEMAARILVRSVAADAAAPVWPVTAVGAITLTGGRPAPGLRRAVRGPGDLSALWDVRDPAPEALTAAARDRGFGSAQDAFRAAQGRQAV
jgi:hypothetical protein